MDENGRNKEGQSSEEEGDKISKFQLISHSGVE